MIIDLMLEQKFWGSIVDYGPKVACFGSCFFIDQGLARAVTKGEHPFLLTDLAENHGLRNRILSYEDVVAESRSANLNFYGALFTFPEANVVPFWDFGRVMAVLQQSLMESMGGFGLGHYFKHSYSDRMASNTKSFFLMRLGFGANSHGNLYKSLPERKTYYPALFSIDRQTASRKGEATPAHQVMSGGNRVFDLSEECRFFIRLQLDGYSIHAATEALGYAKATANGWWNQLIKAIRNDRQALADAQLDREGGDERARALNYIRNNRHRLGVLPLLTPQEINLWKASSTLDGASSPMMTNRTGRSKASS